jgi:hypothetical protein
LACLGGHAVNVAGLPCLPGGENISVAQDRLPRRSLMARPVGLREAEAECRKRQR